MSQRILDLGEVANAHHLEDQSIDVGFEFIEGQGTVALPASWLPGTGAVGSSRGFPSFLPVGVAFAFDFSLVFPLRLPVRPKMLRLVDEGS